jgi:hypothetical protein
MGHIRRALLPRTKKWEDILHDLGNYSMERSNVSQISKKTLDNVKARFSDIEEDRAVNSGFKFVLYLSYASRLENPYEFLRSKNIQVGSNASVLNVAKAINAWIKDVKGSTEYISLTKAATIEAVSEWFQKNHSPQTNIFDGKVNNFDTWRKLSTGSGFCEIARLYFSKFTEKYLSYFLEREASSQIRNFADRERFSHDLEQHLDQISKHSFEISKITESFAAGWFNKNVKEGLPSETTISRFISFAFTKLRNELTSI